MTTPSASTADNPSQVDPRIWRACAGVSVEVPTVYSRVYYFPEGHVEHCCYNYSFSSTPSSSSSFRVPSVPSSTYAVPCLVYGSELLGDPITDEVFASLKLQPVSMAQFLNYNRSMLARDENDEEENAIVSFAKILTPSDANNGGGFSVPRYCADSIFPPLNYHADPPVQKLVVNDIHGVVWEFRHIYRGTPRRHLLTTGWSKFVNAKKLIAGDSVVFMKNSAGEICLGVRRTTITVKVGPQEGEVASSEQSTGNAKEEESDENKPFRRTGKGKISSAAVSEAINRATQGLLSEVVYYPSGGWSDFVVKAEDVEAAMRISWRSGMRVKMARETEDSSRISWFQGTISSTSQEAGRASIWKMLEVSWDEPELLQDMKRVSPWQVQVVSPTPFHPGYPPTKRAKITQTKGLLSAEGRDTNPFIPSFTTSPAGMQGARHYDSRSVNSTGFIEENTPQVLKVSTKMSISSPPPDNLSPNSITTNHSSGTDPVGNHGPISAGGRVASLVLFGTMIYTEPSDSPPNESGVSEEDGSKGSSDTEGRNETLGLFLARSLYSLKDPKNQTLGDPKDSKNQSDSKDPKSDAS